ncbi:MAG: hypothetical protein QMD01_09125 [Thermodesulfovibrionales bacterium]|nr:hypothetical protein [Thermodesulfovibrionales bacterium]
MDALIQPVIRACFALITDHNSQSSKAGTAQSLYQCDEIIKCLFILLNAKGDIEIASNVGGFSAKVSLIKPFHPCLLCFCKCLATDYGQIMNIGKDSFL